ncbi:polyamine ABC transporter substrate-binding protein [Halovulum dunhuangense]|uniref:Putrescine-binding periplasmic protein n=1 Tax=Halovulum dunhuangense TaxID=1505036 RepID=A0A849L0P7_9RHOB|nr:polyamine ABC transporter substrate-binding protein [Halovulum dunhuangense]NNU79848.1 polyamine ABC transporter substrate-binding protein [Halovulum dunhuangense]
MKQRLALAVSAAALAASPLAAQEVLNIYNWSDYIAEDTIEKFTAETGIQVNYDVYDGNEVLEAKLLAGNSGYDIVVPTSDFFQRQIAAGVYQPLDKSKLPNLVNMDENLMAQAAAYDPDNEHGVIYMWGTTGLGYNVGKVEEALGAEAPTDSWALIFEEENISKLQSCGVTMLDTPTEALPAALNYLGYDPKSTDEAELQEAADLWMTVRPYIRYFHSSQYINDLANGDICVAVGYSGDVFIAQARAEESGNGVEIGYSIPNEGALQWFDIMAIPVDAQNPDAAHQFINFVMDPQITADITNYVWYANANKASMPLVDPEVASDPAIFPPEEVKANLWSAQTYDARTDRIVTRLWTQITTGQ